MKRGTYKKCTRKRNKLIKQLKELCRVDYKIDNKTLILKLDISFPRLSFIETLNL